MMELVSNNKYYYYFGDRSLYSLGAAPLTLYAQSCGIDISDCCLILVSSCAKKLRIIWINDEHITEIKRIAKLHYFPTPKRNKIKVLSKLEFEYLFIGIYHLK